MKEIIERALPRKKTCAHGIYEDAFCYYVLDLLQKNDKKSKDEIKKAFKLIEELVSHEDLEVQNVAIVSFIEPFLDELQVTKDIEKYCGPKSLEAARELARNFLIFDPDTWEKKT